MCCLVTKVYAVNTSVAYCPSFSVCCPKLKRCIHVSKFSLFSIVYSHIVSFLTRTNITTELKPSTNILHIYLTNLYMLPQYCLTNILAKPLYTPCIESYLHTPHNLSTLSSYHQTNWMVACGKSTSSLVLFL